MPAVCPLRELVLTVVVASGCSWLPPDAPPPRPLPPDPDASLFHDWTIAGHVLGARALISDLDSAAFHDRKVSITSAGYASPWSGNCTEARRDKQPRLLAEITAAHSLGAASDLGLSEPIAEYLLVCLAGRTPPLTIYVAGSRALTCWSGVCYRLAR